MKFAKVLGLMLLVSALWAGVASGQEVISSEIDSASAILSTTPGLDSPHARFLAIAPILGTATQAPEQYGLHQDPEKRSIFQKRSKSLGSAPNRLALWHDLFLNNGRSGLSNLAKIDLAAYAEDNQGTWVMVERYLGGVPVTNNSIYIWELVEMGDDRLKFNVLLLESGIFETYLALPPANGEEYILGSFTTIDVERITARDEYGARQGLVGGEEAMRVVWRGEIMGHNYGGADKPAPIHVDSLIVKQGGVYNQVRATVAVKDRATRLSDYQTVQLMPMPNNSVAVYGSHKYDSHESFEKVSDQVPVRHLHKFWEMAKSNPKRYMDPQIMADPGRVRKMMERHAAAKAEAQAAEVDG